MTGRRLIGVCTGLALAGSVLATGCSTSNSATVTSTPTPASTVPFETPTPSPTATTSATASATASATVTPRATSTPTHTRSAGASPTPSTLAKPVNTYSLVRGLGTIGNGRYTITYDPVILCTKAAVNANEAPPRCKAKPAKTDADGSWRVRTTTVSVIVALSKSVSGTVYPGGVPFSVTAKNLAKQKAHDGVIFDWSTLTVPALLTVANNEINMIAGARPTN